MCDSDNSCVFASDLFVGDKRRCVFLTLTRNGSQFQTCVHTWAGGAGRAGRAGGAGSPASQAEDPREDLRKGLWQTIS